VRKQSHFKLGMGTKIVQAALFALMVQVSVLSWLPAHAKGFKVGEAYYQPKVDAPARWPTQYEETLQAGISLKDPSVTWWEGLNDPTLNRLIEDAIRNNYNVLAGLSHIREARAQELAATGRLLPLINASAGYSRNQFSDNGTNPIGRFSQMSKDAASAPPGSPPPIDIGINNPTNDFKTGFDATWELDLFGTRRWQLEAARNRIEASLETQRGVILSVISEVARHYVELRQAQSRMAILQKNINLQQQTLNLTMQRFNIGLAPRQDSTQAASQLGILRSNLPAYQANVESSAHAVAILTGREPNSLLAELSTLQPVPIAPEVVGLGLPASLLLRRPDIRQAERELAATSADMASSQAQLYPTLRFTGTWGWEAIRIQDIPKWSSRYWSLNPTVNWPIFQRRELKANVKIAQARYTAQEAQFRQVILNALADVQDAVSNLEAVQNQRQALQAAISQNEQTLQLTTTLYRTGLGNYLSVLDAQRSLVNLQDQQAQSDANATLQTIRLYKALGGGWQAF
jgi:multidrug efflux system outer membrane protein